MTFRVPDLRGYFPVGWADDAASPADAGRVVGTFQDHAILAHAHAGTTGGQSADHTHPYNTGNQVASNGGGTYGLWIGSISGTTGGASNDHTHNFTTSTVGGTRNVPQNVALMACISYL
jgi:hypothetical protein